MRYLVKVFYDGKNFYGYQRQPNLLTIESEIIKALIETNHIKAAEDNHFKSASRTDRYVSAIGNVFAFDSDKKIIIDQINAKCSKNKSIVCWSYGEVRENFSPKFSEWKKYWYLLPINYIRKKANLTFKEIIEISSVFKGEHDFSLFCKVDHRNTKRKIHQINIRKNTHSLIFEFIAPSFLWEQVRRIVAYILSYKMLPKHLQKPEELLVPQSGIDNLNIMPADPNNLVLVEHHYENVKWKESEKSIDFIKNRIDSKLMSLEQEKSLNSTVYNYFKMID